MQTPVEKIEQKIKDISKRHALSNETIKALKEAEIFARSLLPEEKEGIESYKQQGYDEGFRDAYNQVTKEAREEIKNHYQPNKQ